MQIKNIFTYHHQNAEQNCNAKIINRLFQNAVNFKYLKTAIKNQNYVYEELVCMYVCVRGGPNQPLHRDPQWSIVLPLL
jgi:hypothetical protein